MNIKVAHLYYDLMNLYGESGNVKALKMQLEGQGIKTTIKFLTIDDDLNFKDYDIVYIGSGTENNQKIVLNHLLKYLVKEIINKNNKNFKFKKFNQKLEIEAYDNFMSRNYQEYIANK